MQIKTPQAFFGVIVFFVALISLWQFLDGGLDHVKVQLASDPALRTEAGVPKRVFALKARYLDIEREYSLVIIGDKDWTFRRVKVVYVESKPNRVSFQ